MADLLESESERLRRIAAEIGDGRHGSVQIEDLERRVIRGLVDRLDDGTGVLDSGLEPEILREYGLAVQT